MKPDIPGSQGPPPGHWPASQGPANPGHAAPGQVIPGHGQVPPTEVAPPPDAPEDRPSRRVVHHRLKIPGGGFNLVVALFAGAVAGGVTGGIGGLGVATLWEAADKGDDPEEVVLEPDPSSAAAAGPLAEGKLRVLSQPAGAAISMDGEAKGQTPIELMAPGGLHSVALSLEGHEDHAVEVHVGPGETLTLSIALAAAAEETPAAPAGRGGRRRGAGAGYRMPQRDCSGEQSECERGCDDASFSCRSSCMFCTGCVSDRTQEECQRICNTCRQGCEQNESFCERQCQGLGQSCRATLR